jgi:hypothetical protein
MGIMDVDKASESFSNQNEKIFVDQHSQQQDEIANTIDIFDSEELKYHFSRLHLTCDSDELIRCKALVKRLFATGPSRSLCWAGINWRDQLNELESCFPAFAEVIDYVRGVCAVGSLDG